MKPRLYPAVWRALFTSLLLVAMAGMAVTTYADDTDCQPAINIDQPAANAAVAGSTTVNGWAIDAMHAGGSNAGVTDVMIYRDGEVGNGGVLVGQATKVSRPDVDAAYGLSGSQAGWSLPTDFSGMGAGPHTLYAYGLTECGWAFSTVAVSVGTASTATVNVDGPASNATVANGQQVIVGGWAADAAGPGTGVDMVQILADGQLGTGGQTLGTATYGKARPDVAAATGKSAWTNSGYDYVWTVNLAPGQHMLYVYARSTSTGQWTFKTVPITVSGTSSGGSTAGVGSRSTTAVVDIESPDPGVTVRDSVLLRGVAADCVAGTPAQRIRIYRDGNNGVLIGEARVNMGSRTLGSICGAGGPSGPFAWEFNLNTRQLTEGNRTLAAVAEFGSGTASDTISLNIDNTQGGGSGYYNNQYYNNNCYNDPYYSGGYNYGPYNSGCYGSSTYCQPGFVYSGGQCTYVGGNVNCGGGQYGGYYPYDNSGCYGSQYCQPGYVYNGYGCSPGGYGYNNCAYGSIYNPTTGYCAPSGSGYGTCGSGAIRLDQHGTTLPISSSVQLTGYALLNTALGSAQPAQSVQIRDISTSQFSQTIPVTSYPVSRTDAQNQYGQSAAQSGYIANYNTSGLGGSYFNRIIEVVAYGPGGCTFSQTFTVSISPNSGGGSNSVVSVANASAQEGGTGSGNFIAFTVSVNPTSNTGFTVQYNTVNGTGAAGVDYVGANGTLTFVAGQTSQQVFVQTIGNNTPAQGNRTFTLQLSNVSGGATLSGGTSSATGTILEDD